MYLRRHSIFDDWGMDTGFTLGSGVRVTWRRESPWGALSLPNGSTPNGNCQAISKTANQILGFHWFSPVSGFPEIWRPETQKLAKSTQK
jgi:hypothetical protein